MKERKPVITSIYEATGEDMLWLRDHRCHKHGHRYVSHFGCFLKETGIEERIMFLDIETAGSLDANWGIVISYAWCDLENKKGTVRKIRPREIKQPDKYHRDKRLIEQFCEDVKPYNVICVYYGRDKGGRYQRHDIPFLRTRAYAHKIKTFPRANSKKVVDVYDIISGKLKLSHNRMADAARLIGIPCKEHPINIDMWLKALAGIQEGIDYIGDLHNLEDVYTLRALWKEVSGYAKRGSI